jgi:hypothetical protein
MSQNSPRTDSLRPSPAFSYPERTLGRNLKLLNTEGTPLVQTASRRKAKYLAKFDPAVIETRLIAVKANALINADAAFDSLTAMELLTQAALNEDSIPGCDRPKYYNFAREVWKLVNSGFVDPALTAAVVTTLGPKYESLDCAPATLIKIALSVFSIILPP